MDQKLLVQTRVLLVCAQPWSLSPVFCNIIQLHSTLQSYICKALVRAKHIIIILYHKIIIHVFLVGLKPVLYITVQCTCVYNLCIIHAHTVTSCVCVHNYIIGNRDITSNYLYNSNGIWGA